MGRISEKLFVSIILLVMLAWAGYHAFQYYHNPLQTEAVFEYTVSRSVSTTGIAFRDEQVVEKPSSGVENYLYADGTRVSIGQTIAEFYPDSSSDKNVKRMREIEKEIAMLAEAQDTTVNNFSNTDVLSRDLREKLNGLTEMGAVGSYSQVSDLKYNLTSLLNRRQIATGKTDSFEGRISELQAEYARLEQSTSTAIVTAASPTSGYFSKQVDGYEELLNTENLSHWAIDDYKRLIEADAVPEPKGNLGKLATSHDWYFAVVLDKYEVDWVRTGQEVALWFERLDESVTATVKEILSTNEDDEAAVIFVCNQMSDELINLRRSNVTIQFYRYNGLRISTASLRFVDGVQGVYILDGKTVRFKSVEPLYEEAGFVLSTMNYINSTDKENVRLFDQVITWGNDLYDGKVIN